MRIISAEAFLASVPQARPIALSGGVRITHLPHAIIRIRTAGGFEGTGWAYRLGLQDAGALIDAARAIASAAQELDAAEPSAAVATAVERTKLVDDENLRMAASALDIACWDAQARAADLPLAQFLGAHGTRVPVYATGDLWREAGPEDIRAAVARHRRDGYTAFKLRIGGETDPAAEEARMAAAREAAGDGTLLADVNQGWSVDQAIAAKDWLAPYKLGWLEDPVHHADVAGLATVAAAHETPVCAGEHCYTLEAARALLDQKAVDVLMLDVMRIGGVSGWLTGARMAQEAGVPVVAHLCPEVSVHLMAASPNAWLAEWLSATTPLLERGLRLRDGALAVPTEPGLGVNIDPAALRRFAA